jgi:L-threonylcarbamoyladenylate synthase
MITNNLEKAILTLKNNELIAIPTETVYGLAGNAFSNLAVKKIFELKNRPAHNPLIVHIKSSDYLPNIAEDIPEKAFELAKNFWPGPLTLVLKRKKNILDTITSGKDTVAIRVPNHPLSLELLNQLDFPLAAPSANPFGQISPTSAEHVFSYFKNDLDVILDGGECKSGVESTIIGFEENQAILYRYGAISVEEIEQVIGEIRFLTKDDKKPSAPGMLSKHYAPRKEIYFTNKVSELANNFQNKKIGFILYKDFTFINKNCFKEVLSESGNLTEATMNLYEALHKLDNSDCDLIIAEKFPDEGLGRTINDRLIRATK